MSPKRLRDHSGNVDFLGSFPGAVPAQTLPEIAFVGRSNVGKSSALNALLGGRRAARVSSTPGRTQLVNLFKVGSACVFVDLPGYGFADVPDEVTISWKPMIEAYLGERPNLRLVVSLIDGRLPPQEIDTILIEGLRDFGTPLLVVATKIDRLSKHEIKPALHRFHDVHQLDPGQPIAFSAKSRMGVDALWDHLEAACATP
jgi:GTP-binding protein